MYVVIDFAIVVVALVAVVVDILIVAVLVASNCRLDRVIHPFHSIHAIPPPLVASFALLLMLLQLPPTSPKRC